MSLVVIKFGGTSLLGRSVLNEEELLEDIRRSASVDYIYRRIVEARSVARSERLKEIAHTFILPQRREGRQVVVVVSAIGRATDKLAHLERQVTSEPDPRESARLLMTGELRSNALMAMALNSLECPARSLTGREAGIVSTPEFRDADILRVEPSRIIKDLEAGHVAVVAGFQGFFTDPATGRDEASILKRGGSDLTAIALAHALQAQDCFIYTDVRGVYDKDPNIYPDARKYDKIAFQDFLAITPFPTVMQRDSVTFAMEKGVSFWVRSSFHPQDPGTLVVPG